MVELKDISAKQIAPYRAWQDKSLNGVGATRIKEHLKCFPEYYWNLKSITRHFFCIKKI